MQLFPRQHWPLSPRRRGRGARRAGVMGVALCAMAALALAGGCASDAKKRREQAGKQSPLPSERRLNETLVNLPFDQQIAAGALADRTMYEHYFAGDGVTLNALGERHIEALVEVATDRPIIVNVPDTGGPDGLHEARVAAIRQRLVEAGVSEDRIEIADAAPGGPGISSEIVIQRMAAAAQRQGTGTGAGRPQTTGSSSDGTARSARPYGR